MKFRIIPAILSTIIPCLFEANGQTIQDTTSPNVFWFSSSEYTVTETETYVLITVNWSPGSRGYSGWVDYTTADGSATSGADYVPAAGRLYFSSPASASFKITIHQDEAVEGEETIQVFLANPQAIIPTSNAVVRISDPVPTPRIDFTRNQDQTICLSWPAQEYQFVLERSDAPTSGWQEVVAIQSANGGVCQVTQPAIGTLGFYRLRRAP